jgi:PAS domain S-box-containing protein
LTVKTGVIPRLLIFSLALVAPCVAAQTPVNAPRTIRVVMDNYYAPYSFQSDEGKLQGILIDQWQAWEKKTGIKVEIHAMDWDEALRRMRAGEFDVIDSIVETPERRGYFDFTPAYTPIEASIFFRNDISGITDLASLKGFPVGVKAGDQHIDRLKENGVTTLILFQNNEAIIESAKQRKINVFVADDPSALYLLNKAGIEGEFRHSAPIFRDELRRAVRKGDAATLSIVSKGFAAMDAGELKQIDEKWFGRTINTYGRYLTYAGYAAAVAILLIAGLVGWNSALRKRILQRTAALGDSEERFRQIAENIHEVFWLCTADLSNVLYVSPAYESVWGRSREILYRDPRSFSNAIHDEDRPNVVTIVERDREHGFEVEYRVVRPDGSIRWIWDRGFPIRDESGRFYRLAGIAEDITNRKLAEGELKKEKEILEKIFDNIPAMIGFFDEDGRVKLVNSEWELTMGWTLKELQEQNVDTFAEAYPDPSYRQEVLDFVAASTGEWVDFKTKVRDGRVIDAACAVVHLSDGTKFAIAQDITERKQAEEQLRATTEQLRTLSARIHSAKEEEGTRIAREIHDELGAVLSSLRWDLEDVDEVLSEPPERSQLAALRKQIKAMIGLTDTTINTVRRIASELRPIALDEFGIAEAIQWHAQQFQARTGIIVNCDCSLENLALNREQSTAVFRIFQEAMTNILRHAQATRVDITLKQAGVELVLTISDNGRGITEADKSRSQSLGLLGMRERAHLIGGKIDINGAEDKGTVVTVQVPIPD